MMKFAFRALPLALLLLGSTLARADMTEPNTFRLGEYFIFYHVSASDLSGPYAPAGVGLDVDNVSTPYIAYLRQLSPHFIAELAFGIPPLTKTYGRGPATVGSVPYNGQEISTARWFAPTLLLEYMFFDDNTPIRPYIGAGINYTSFYDRDSTVAGNEASGGPTRLELRSSVGPAGTVGINWNFAPHWNVMASYSITRVISHLDAITDGVVRTSEINFGPQALVVAAGFSF